MIKNTYFKTSEIPNLITLSRVVISSLLLFLQLPLWLFITLYIICGVSDILDGFLARKTNTESKKGELLDSLADLLFTVMYIVKIIPNLNFILRIWIWIFLIFIIKLFGIMMHSWNNNRLSIKHCFLNKFIGFLLFVLPFTINFVNVNYGVVFICVIATIAAINECRGCSQ